MNHHSFYSVKILVQCDTIDYESALALDAEKLRIDKANLFILLIIGCYFVYKVKEIYDTQPNFLRHIWVCK